MSLIWSADIIVDEWQHITEYIAVVNGQCLSGHDDERHC